LVQDGRTLQLPKEKESNLMNGYEYGLAVTFKVNRELSKQEVDRLIDAVAVQVEEPAGLDGAKRAEFVVFELTIEPTEGATK
jgi:hypothetical protein